MMRLRALRVADVRRFDRPMALEGLGHGLNVLAGPNELGKSTLLAALKAVLQSRYSSKAGPAQELMPNGGGNPEIEADFEINGLGWRIRKRFIRTAMAELTDLKTGAVLKNADAEIRLEALLKGPPELERFGLLWVDQGADQITGKEKLGGLAGLVGAEINALALDGPGRAVQTAVLAALDKLRTKQTGRAKKGGTWEQAAARLAEAEQVLREAAQRKTEQQGRLDALGELHTARAELLAPEAAAARTETLAGAEKRLHAARAAEQQAKLAGEQNAAALAQLSAAEQAHKTLGLALADVARLKTEAGEAATLRVALDERRNLTRTALAEAEQVAGQGVQTLAALETELTAARAAAAAQDAGRRAAQVADRFAKARDSETTLSAAQATVARLAAVTEARVKDLRAVLGDLEKIDSAFAAVVPDVAIEPLAGAGDKITVGGKPVQSALLLKPDAPLVIEIAGIGRIRIAPNPATVTPEKRAERTAKQATATTLYGTLGVATLVDAEQRLSERQRAEATQREAHAKLSALAPGGVQALLDEHAILLQQVAHAPGTTRPVPEVSALLEKARGERVTEQRALKTAEAAAQAVDAELNKLEAATAARERQMALLAERLGPQTEQARQSRESDEALTLARRVFNDAKIALEAWRSNPDLGRIDELTRALAAAEQADTQASQRAAALDRQIAELEGAIRAAGDDDVEGSFARAQARRDAAQHAHADIELDVQALGLLESTLADFAASTEATVSAPLRARLAPYLGRVFPDAALQFGDGLAPHTLARGSRLEAHKQLSRGTREQIAVLVRLGLAQLLSERNAGVPLILDDAMVYADDARTTQMFEALLTASVQFQVLMLTCRAEAFGSLARARNVPRLELTPWKM